MAENTKDREITITREYDAPVTLVWEAWTDLKHVGKWWGPRGFTLTTHSKDLKAGGHWHYTMHGPDGTNYPNKTIYYEVEEFKRLVYDHGGNDEQAPLFRVTVLFEDLGNKTRMHMTMLFPSVEIAKQTIKFIKIAGGNSTWDRLAEYLIKETDQEEVFVIHRSFAASEDKLKNTWNQVNFKNDLPELDMKTQMAVSFAQEEYEQTRIRISIKPRDKNDTIFVKEFCQKRTDFTLNWNNKLDDLEEKLKL